MNALIRKALPTAVVAMALSTLGALAQGPVGLGNITGHVNDTAGVPIKGAVVEFTKDMGPSQPKDKVYQYKFTTDENGDYSGKDVAAGTYFGTVLYQEKYLDYAESVKVEQASNLKVDFDMTRKAYIDALSPEAKAALDAYKKKAAEANAVNKVVNNLNTTLKNVRADLAAAAPTKGDVSKDVADMKAAVDSKPDENILHVQYGATLDAQGDHLAAADRAAGKPVMSDDEVVKMYTDAAAEYQKGIDLMATASKKPSPGDEGAALNQLGNIYGKLGKATESAAAFDKATAIDPPHAGMYYNNEAAIMYNTHQMDGALAAADKAIAADPDRPDPYYIKGQVLVQKASVDSKTGKITTPPGCVDAYQHFIGVAGDDPKYKARVEEVKQVLTGIGEKIETKYTAPKKK